MTDTEVRDRILNPSINFPLSQDEATRAIVGSLYRGMTSENYHGVDLSQPFTNDAGFSMIRTDEQTKWLENARLHVRANLIRKLDELV